MNKLTKTYAAMIALAVFGFIGWTSALTGGASAQTASSDAIGGETLDDLYDVVFHRPADAEGRAYHLGRPLRDVLSDFRRAPEQRYYGALFKATKAYEEAQRAPGDLTEEEKQAHLDLIESALANLLAWVETLPDQDACRATVNGEEARAAVQAAYDRLNESVKPMAERGLFRALDVIGQPTTINIRTICPRPTSTVGITPPPPDNPTPVATLAVTPLGGTPTPTPILIDDSNLIP